MDDLELVDDNLRVQIQSDNASSHIAVGTRAEYEQRGLITMQGWPPCSPDLSLIKNIWATLKRAIFNRQLGPHRREEMNTAAMEEWENLDQRVITSFIESMPRRIDAVIAANGGSTHY